VDRSHADRLVADLAGAVGAEHVLTRPEDTARYCVDWSRRFCGGTPAVVLPGSAAEVAGVVQACRAHGAAVVPQGGNTGLVGGGVPLAGEIVVSLGRLRRIHDVDATTGQLTAGAGVTLADVQRAAQAAGWAYGVDFASRERATVGGTVATNAGGLRVLRHGDTRAQLLGVEAVLGDGSTISHLGGLLKDNTGYHLPSLLCGSEGTLGIVTAARLRLVPRADERVVALLAFDAVGAAVAAAGALRRDVRSLEAAELFLADGLALVCQVSGLAPPCSPGPVAYLLVEAADRVSPATVLTAAVASLTDVADVVVAVGAPARAALWAYREQHAAAVNTLGPPHKFDVTLPGSRLVEFVEAVPATIAALVPAGRIWMWGHAADGNLHVNVTGVDPGDHQLDEAVLSLVAGLGGSISAEHGIGTAKRAWLSLNRSPAEIDAFRAVKRALDPDGILNPNVLLPPVAPAG
jgi:FAD/FMN-containing dehydrogenase